MTKKKLLALCTLCALLCFAFGVLSGTVFAQGDSDSAKAIDKDRATKKGVSNSLASGKKEKEGDDGPSPPTKPQMALGAGSFIVMIIVVKWL